MSTTEIGAPELAGVESLSGVRGRRVAYYLGIGLAIALFFWLSARHITSPGVHYDEVLPAPAAIHLVKGQVNADYNRVWSVTIAGRTFPVMDMEYMGALKSYLLAPVFFLFGINVTALRLTGILVTLLGLVFTARFAAAAFGTQAALWGTWLVATDPSFILYFKTDFGPLAAAFLLRMAALFYLARWWKSGGRLAPLIAASALLGLGIYDKTNFLWFVVALAVVGAGLWLVSRERPRLTGRHLALALITLLLASAPLWVFNLRNNWVTFKMAALPGESVSLAKLIQLVPRRTVELKSMLNGQANDVWMFGQPLTPHLGIKGTWLLPLSVAAVAILVVVGLATRRWRLLALPALMAVMLGQMYLTPRPVWVWHFIGLYPFPHLAVGLALVVIGQAVGPRWRAAVMWGGSVVLLMALCFNLLAMANYYQLMRETGGRGTWGETIYPLAETLKTQYADRPIQLMDWGVGNQLFFLSAGQLRLHEPFWAYLGSPQPAEELVRLVADPTNVFIVHTPPETMFPNPRAALDEAVRRAGAVVKAERQFYNRRSKAVYTLFEFSPRPGPSQD